MISQEHKTRLWEQVQTAGPIVLTEKDQDLLAKMISSEPMVKALSAIWYDVVLQPSQFMGLDLSEPGQVVEGAKIQGRAQGMLNAIELLFNLITLPEEDLDDDE